MAIAFVRSIAGNGNFVGSVTLVLAGVASGNKLVLTGAAWADYGTNAVPSSVTSSPAATWRNDVNSPMSFMGPNQGNQTFLWSADTAAAGTTSVTATWPSAAYPQLCLA